ncbi:hypothetical protein BDV06DRAFT_214723 [Aspergillus oleicola]
MTDSRYPSFGIDICIDILSMSAVVGTEQYITFFDSPVAAGSVVGSIISGYLSNRFGRQDVIFLSCTFWIIGKIIQTAVQNWQMLLIGRVINGVTVGVTGSQQIAIDFGFTIYFFVGYGCSFIPGPASFRTTWGVQFVPCALLMASIPFLPESPRWPASKDRVDEALSVLAKIQSDGNTQDATVIAEWNDIMTTLQIERDVGLEWRKFVLNRIWKRALVVFMVQACQKLAGANVIIYYVVYLLKMANLSGKINLIASSMNCILALICIVIAFFYINQTGSCPLLIYVALAMGACHIIIGAMIAAYKNSAPGGVSGNLNVIVKVTCTPSRVIIAFSHVLIAAFYLRVAPNVGIATVGNWEFNFVLGMFIPHAPWGTDFGSFILFGALCIFAATFGFFMYPETCGKTLEEVDVMFAKGEPPRRGDPACYGW